MIDILKEKLEMFNKVLTEIPELRYVGDPVLRQKTESVDTDEGKIIADKLGNILMKYRTVTGMGRGLAAPQIGLNKSVFVTFVDNKLHLFINPVIIERSPTTNFYKELCLSSEIMGADVERPEWIIMEWTDEKGLTHTEKIESFLARLYQHEEAHLRGRINLDDAAPQGIEFATFDPLKEQLRTKR